MEQYYRLNVNDARIVGLVLPVDFNESVSLVLQAIDELNPVLTVCTGLSARSFSVHVEKCAWNIKKLSRNESLFFRFRRLDSQGSFLYISPLDTVSISQGIRDAEIQARSSFYPGYYVCNAVYYSVLRHSNNQKKTYPAVFLHVPLLTNQSTHGMELDSMIQAVRITIISALASR